MKNEKKKILECEKEEVKEVRRKKCEKNFHFGNGNVQNWAEPPCKNSPEAKFFNNDDDAEFCFLYARKNCEE